MDNRIRNHLYSTSAWNRLACGQQISKSYIQHFCMEQNGMWATEFEIICTAFLHGKGWYMGNRIRNHLYNTSAWNRMACGQQNLKSLGQHFCIAAFLCTVNLSISMRQQKKMETLELKIAEMERQWFLCETEWHVGNRIWNHVYSNSVTISYNLIYNDNENQTASIHSWLLFVSYHSIFYYIIFFNINILLVYYILWLYL